MDKLDSIKMKNFCASTSTIENKRQPAKREKMFANHVTDESSIQTIENTLTTQ